MCTCTHRDNPQLQTQCGISTYFKNRINSPLLNQQETEQHYHPSYPQD